MLDGDNRNYAVTNVLSVKVIILSLEVAKFPCILIHNSCKCSLKACYEGSSVYYIDTVTIGIYLFRVAICVLEGSLNLYISGLSLHIDNFIIYNLCLTVDVFDIAFDTVFFFV